MSNIGREKEISNWKRERERERVCVKRREIFLIKIIYLAFNHIATVILKFKKLLFTIAKKISYSLPRKKSI